jgi:pSer/pThr/pTyr-binding forkhead associated (FHA) protein
MAQLYLLNGPERGRSFKLREGVNFVGRSLDNDVHVEETTVSRKHLKILQKGEQYFITDLKSLNGTYLDGASLHPGQEVEVREGVPIAIGKCVICISREALRESSTFMDTMEIRRDAIPKNGIFSEDRDKTDREKLQFLYDVSDILGRSLPLKEALEKILDDIFTVMKGIDRGAFILVDSRTRKVTEAVTKSKKPAEEKKAGYSRRIVKRVLEKGNPIVISNMRTGQHDELVDTLEVSKIECALCVPMVSRSQVLGAIYVDSRQKAHGFREEDLYLFMDLGQRIALAIDNERFSSEVSRIAESLLSGD